MYTALKPSKDILNNIPSYYFQNNVPKDFNPASICWVTPSIGITAWDGVADALNKGYFVINVAGEIDNSADIKIPIQPGSGTVKECLNDMQSIIQSVIKDKNQKVVVHCAMGMERSVLSVVWYLHKNENLTVDEAYDLVRKSRPIALDHRDWITS